MQAEFFLSANHCVKVVFQCGGQRLQVVVKRRNGVLLRVQMHQTGTIRGDIEPRYLKILGFDGFLQCVPHPLRQRGQILARKSVLVFGFGQGCVPAVDFVEILIEQQEFLVRLANVKNRGYGELHEKPGF